jgi:ABC-type ATPase with predicted acetyltransferase domain
MNNEDVIKMKVWICDDCGAEVGMGQKPDKCGKCGADELIEIERADESGHGCKGPLA